MQVDLAWTPQAEIDLHGIYARIGMNSVAAAETWFERIRERARQLESHPRSGPRRRDIARSLRMLTVAPYLILYESEPDTDEGPVDRVVIVRVVDGRRNLYELF